MRHADHRRLGHGGVEDQSALHLGGAHAVARDVDHIVHAAGDPVIPFPIAAGAVAGGVFAGKVLK
jgi:hypothetical protein